jgi:uncharacterized protein (DUF433 family)
MLQSPASHIEIKPEVCGGKPCIAGTRIRVQDIYVWHSLQGQSLGDVFAALAYYWDHQEEISQQMREETAFMEDLKRKQISALTRKLGARSDAKDSLPSG